MSNNKYTEDDVESLMMQLKISRKRSIEIWEEDTTGKLWCSCDKKYVDKKYKGCCETSGTFYPQ